NPAKSKKVVNYLLLALDEVSLRILRTSDWRDCLDAWTLLCQYWQSTVDLRLLTLRRELNNMRMGSKEDPSTFIGKALDVVEQLRNGKQEIEASEVVTLILNALPE